VAGTLGESYLTHVVVVEELHGGPVDLIFQEERHVLIEAERREELFDIPAHDIVQRRMAMVRLLLMAETAKQIHTILLLLQKGGPAVHTIVPAAREPPTGRESR
jgi:hypothetical protein